MRCNALKTVDAAKMKLVWRLHHPFALQITIGMILVATNVHAQTCDDYRRRAEENRRMAAQYGSGSRVPGIGGSGGPSQRSSYEQAAQAYEAAYRQCLSGQSTGGFSSGSSRRSYTSPSTANIPAIFNALQGILEGIFERQDRIDRDREAEIEREERERELRERQAEIEEAERAARDEELARQANERARERAIEWARQRGVQPPRETQGSPQNERAAERQRERVLAQQRAELERDFESFTREILSQTYEETRGLTTVPGTTGNRAAYEPSSAEDQEQDISESSWLDIFGRVIRKDIQAVRETFADVTLNLRRTFDRVTHCGEGAPTSGNALDQANYEFTEAVCPVSLFRQTFPVVVRPGNLRDIRRNVTGTYRYESGVVDAMGNLFDVANDEVNR